MYKRQGLDVAASEMYNEETKKYVLAGEGKELTAAEMVDLYEDWTTNFPIITIEDGLDEEDWAGWKVLTERSVSYTHLDVYKRQI